MHTKRIPVIMLLREFAHCCFGGFSSLNRRSYLIATYIIDILAAHDPARSGSPALWFLHIHGFLAID